MDTLNYDAFPRSGSRSLSTILGLAFPDYQIFGGSHNPTTLNKQNAITVVRPYKEVIASWFDVYPEMRLLKKSLDLQQGINAYVYFYKYIQEFDIFYCSLESLTQKPNEVMSLYAQKYNLQNVKLVDVQEYNSIMTKDLPRHYPKTQPTDRQTIFEMIETCDLSEVALSWEAINKRCVTV